MHLLRHLLVSLFFFFGLPPIFYRLYLSIPLLLFVFFEFCLSGLRNLLDLVCFLSFCIRRLARRWSKCCLGSVPVFAYPQELANMARREFWVPNTVHP